MLAELTTVQYEPTPNGLNKVEGKNEMRRRLGYSPDLADAFILTLARSGKARNFGKPIVYQRIFH